MKLIAIVKDFFAKTADARFKRDAQGRLVFLPWGFGRGRLVPDANVEAQLRQACVRLTAALFVMAIPVMAGIGSVYQPKGLAFVGYVSVCAAIGFAFQIYPAWLSRNLPRSEERVAYSAAMLHSLDRFGKKFLVFGLVTSLVFMVSATVMLILGAGPDRLAMAICVVIFAPTTIVYALALKRRLTGKDVSA